MAETKEAAAVWKSIKARPLAMMTTIDEGRLVSRPMASYIREDEGLIYFLTKMDTIKTRDVDQDSAVNLAYADPQDNTWISVSGNAKTSQDRAKMHELWSKEAEAWLPEGPDAPDVGLITVTPDDAVIWDGTSSKILHALKLVKAIVTQSPPDTGRVEKVAL